MVPVTDGSVVTDIAPDRRAPDHLVIEVDGARFASLPADVVAGLDLRRGEALGPERLAALHEAANLVAAHRVALRLLAVRGRSVQELRRKLREKGHVEPAVGQAIERLRGIGYLDDREYARNYVEVRARKGEGPAKLSAGLQQRGVDRQTAEAAVAEVLRETGYDELAAARAVAEKRARQLRDLAPEVKRRRLVHYLGRRGFPGGTVIEVVEEVLRG